MNRFTKHLPGIAMVSLGVALMATSPGASTEHFLVTNDGQGHGDITATVLKLSSPTDPTLTIAKTLVTGSKSQTASGIPSVQMIEQGSGACIFVSDSSAEDIASFTYPAGSKVGNFVDPNVTSPESILIAAQSKVLVAAYTGQNSYSIAVWSIGSGCTLRLLNTVAAPQIMLSIALSPDSKTLAVAYFGNTSAVDSFSLGPNGQLTEHGPYSEINTFDFATSVDITAESKYALFGEMGYAGSQDTQVGIFPINSDGSLGPDHDFGGSGSLGSGVDVGAIRLSPNEKFLFASDVAGGSLKETTLNFDESVPSVSYGCIVAPRGIKTPDEIAGMATALPSGAGGFLYLTETATSNQIGLFAINPTTGCLTEATKSPAIIGESGALQSIATWPPRPF